MGEYDFIGVQFGVWATLNDVFCRMLCHPQTFRGIGNPSEENFDGMTVPSLYTDAVAARARRAIPKSRVRQIFATILAKVAFDFIVWHELTHLMNGHVDFFLSSYGSRFVQEAVNSSTDSDYALSSQAVEMDADCEGARHCLFVGHDVMQQMKRGDFERRPGADERMAWRLALGTPTRVFYTVLFSIYTFFRLFDELEWRERANLCGGAIRRLHYDKALFFGPCFVRLLGTLGTFLSSQLS